MTHDAPRHSALRHTFYDILLAVLAGFAVGWFAWVFGGRLIGTDTTETPLWPFAAVGVVGVFALIKWARSRRPEPGWIHLLWIPVVLFVVLMTLIVMALNNFN